MTTTTIQISKVSKYWSLIKENGICAAIFNHRTHILFFKEYCRPDYGNLPVNSFFELGIDAFYDKLEKIEA